LLQSSLAENERPLIQGINDTLLAIASSLASLSSGVLYAGFGWQTLASTTLVALTLAIVFLFVSRRKTTA
jgi:predicted MFS family arabinose efflux permease